MALIQSGSSSSLLTIDSTSTAARTTLYDINGNAMCDVASLNNILNALNANVTFTLAGQSTVGFNVSSASGTLTLSFEATIDNNAWFSINATPIGGGSPVSSVTGNGQWLADTGGFYAVRARVSAFTSGSMTVSTIITPAPSKNIAQTVTAAGTISVSGTVTANQGSAAALAGAWPVEVTDGTNVLGTSSHPLRMDPTGTTTQPVSGTVTVNAGSGTFTVGGTVTANIGTTNGLALDTSVNGLLLSQGSATSGQKGTLTLGAVTTAAPSYTTAQTSPLSLTTSGALRIDGSAVTQPVSGTVTVNAGSGTFTVSGTVNQGTAAALSGSWPVEVTDGTNVLGTSAHPVRTDPTGTTTQPVSGTVTANAGTGNFTVTQATAANLNATVSGTVTSNQGTANSTANAWTTKVTDGTNTAAVKAASSGAAATDPSLVVALSPNSPLPNLRTVDSANSSTAALGSGATFTGTGTSALGVATISVMVMAIGATAPPGTLTVQQSSDNSNWDIQDIYSVAGGTVSPTGEFDIMVNMRAQFYRVVYTNGATAQTAFRLQTLQIPVSSPLPDAPTQKGMQAQVFLPVQEPKDTGRTIKVYEAAATTGTTADTMVTLTPLTNFTAGATGTTFTVTAGKTFRIQAINAAIRATTTTALSASNFRFRVSASGAVTTATPVIASILLPATAGAINAGTSNTINFNDGLELSGTMQFGISMLASSTSSTFDVQIIGFEY